MPTKRALRRRADTPAPHRIEIQRDAGTRLVPPASKLRAYADAALTGSVGRRAEITIRLVGLREARRLNRMFRSDDHPTNVLSFGYGDPRRGEPMRGDLVICHPVLIREARTQRKGLEAHYAHLVVHGILHLRGMTHTRRAARLAMEAREIAILARLGFGNPYEIE